MIKRSYTNERGTERKRERTIHVRFEQRVVMETNNGRNVDIRSTGIKLPGKPT